MANDDTKHENEQMAFSFYEELAPKKSVAEREFDTEDDALDALLSTNEPEEETEPPHPLSVDCCCAVNLPANQPDTLPPPESTSGERDLSSPAVTDLETAEDADNVFDTADDSSAAAADAADADEAIDAIETAMNEAETVTETAQSFEQEIRAIVEEETEAEPEEKTAKKQNTFPPLTEQTIRRAAAGFLASLKPSAIGLKFASGIPRIKVDAGAFFLSSSIKEPAVGRTVLVMTCVDREKCRYDAAKKEALLKELSDEKTLKAELEEKLKVSEPDLKDDSLFPESQTWDFARTKNRKYHACLHKIEKLEYAICHGSKFERMMFEQTATEYYLAVPEGLITADELPAEWGLVHIASDFTATVVREAKKCDCPQEKRMAFALHAAAAGADDFLFANGITLADGSAKFHQLPKRRKAYSK